MLWKLIMYYGNIKKTDIANGTGVRVSLFVSGCRRHCKDCFNSGFAFEELVGECEDILKYIDVLVDGAFVAEKKNLKLKFRGSENQRIINVKKSLEDKTVTELTEGEYDEY